MKELKGEDNPSRTTAKGEMGGGGNRTGGRSLHSTCQQPFQDGRRNAGQNSFVQDSRTTRGGPSTWGGLTIKLPKPPAAGELPRGTLTAKVLRMSAEMDRPNTGALVDAHSIATFLSEGEKEKATTKKRERQFPAGGKAAPSRTPCTTTSQASSISLTTRTACEKGGWASQDLNASEGISAACTAFQCPLQSSGEVFCRCSSFGVL